MPKRESAQAPFFGLVATIANSLICSTIAGFLATTP
jgi:hypothetical protein